MITLTDAATTKVKELLDQEGEAALALRVAVRPGGCSGFSYEMLFDADRAADDEAFTYDNGVNVVVDPTSAQLLVGATLDYKDGLQQAGFDMLSLDPRQAFETMLFSAGGSLFNADSTEPEFNSKAGVDALQLMTDLINTHKVEDLGYSSAGAAVNPLLNGRAAMGIAHNNLFTQAQESAPEILDQLQPFAITGSEPGMFFGGTLATVSSKTKNPKAAQALLEFLTSSGPALAANQQRGNVPAETALLDSDYVKSNRFVQFAMENLAIAKREGGPAKWIQIRGDFTPAIEAALLQKESPQKALDDLAAAAKSAIQP